MKTLKFAFAILGALITLPVAADSYTNSLSICFADNTTGKERKDLAKWIFVAMSAHPEMQNLSKVSSTVRDELNQTYANLVTRLIVKDCNAQTRDAMQKEGQNGLKIAFESFGRLAMQELMTNDKVTASISQVERFIDSSKIQSALAPK